MASNSILVDQDKIVVEVEIDATPDKVFQALTDPAQVRVWSGNPDYELVIWEMDLRAGGAWRSLSRKRADHIQQFDHQGKVVEIDRPRLLVYSWSANWHENPAHESLVRWELTPTTKGTHVKVTHSGLKAEPKALQGYSQGWPGLVLQVKNYLER